MKKILTIILTIYTYTTYSAEITNNNAGEVKDNTNTSYINTKPIDEVNYFNNTRYFSKQNKRAIKVGYTSLLLTNLEVLYEQGIKPTRSWEVSLGVIGIGLDLLQTKPRGGYMSFSYKFIGFQNDYEKLKNEKNSYGSEWSYSNNYSSPHLLGGVYLAPELRVRYFEHGLGVLLSGFDERNERFDLVLSLKLGKQMIISDTFLLDLFVGIGYGIHTDTVDKLDYIEGINFSLPYGGIFTINELVVSAGLKAGWLF